MHRRHTALLLLALSAQIGLAQGKDTEKPKQRIVFVCEHGAALSVVSAAYFNKLAREKHLPFEAIARGVNPQEEIAVSARNGLAADGVPLTIREFRGPRQTRGSAAGVVRPQPLSSDDVAGARRIVAFCPLPARFSGGKVTPVENWSDVPPTGAGGNYALARDAILRHLRELIRQLKTGTEPQTHR
jgi:arsenate reductase